MKIRLGYACLPITLEKVTASSTMTYSYYQKLETTGLAISRLNEIILSNFNDLKKIIHYNYKNDIEFFRLTSSLIPLDTHPLVNYEIYNRYSKEFIEIGNLIKQYNVRMDVHPDIFCVINSVNPDVVASSINILKNAYNMFKAMKLDGKIILHVGGASYGKKAGINRFIKTFKTLPVEYQKMIVVENDDKTYNAEDVLFICKTLNIPMVFDYHHHICNPCDKEDELLLNEVIDTWNKENVVAKMHYSSPKNSREKRTHHDYIDLENFIEFLRLLKKANRDVDVMLEAKKKDEALFRLVRGLKYKNLNVVGTKIIM